MRILKWKLHPDYSFSRSYFQLETRLPPKVDGEKKKSGITNCREGNSNVGQTSPMVNAPLPPHLNNNFKKNQKYSRNLVRCRDLTDLGIYRL